MTLDWAAAFMVGILGSGHCMGMCGGIASLLNIHRQKPSVTIPLFYNVGRLISYSLFGAIIGGAVSSLALFSSNTHILTWLRLLAALFMILLGLHISNWWKGLVIIEKAGQYIWKYISPLGQSLLPLKSPMHALPYGFVWGWLPCGLVYSMLTWASVTGSAAHGALTMLFFGLGTLPSMLAIGYGSQWLSPFQTSRHIRRAGAALLITFGVYTASNTLIVMNII